MTRAVLVFLAVSLSAQNRLTPQEERGRQIFERGTSPSGSSIEASLAGDARVAGSILPCANCHGHDGRGRPEGGVVPSNITWDELTKPYGLTHPDGRTHPAYTERLLKRAITLGIDPAGNTLNTAMPRFQLSMADASDLLAYIKKLGNTVDPGLSASAVRLGVILPPPSQASKTCRILRQALLDYFARLNGAGGIFSRQIELTFTELPSNPAERAEAVRTFLRNDQVFAVVGDFGGAESELAGVMRDTGTPAVAALATFPQLGAPLNAYVFYLDGGVQEEMDALLDVASQRSSGSNLSVAIVLSDQEPAREIANRLQARLVEGGRRPTVIGESMRPVPADLVFWLRPDLGALLTFIAADRQTTVLIPGSLADSPWTTPAIPNVQVFIALGPNTMWEDAPGSVTRLTRDRATASAAILAEAMKLAGRGLTRTSLLAAIEGLQDVQTNLPALVSFGPNRRMGASGVRIMTIDPRSGKFVSAPGGGRAK